MKLATWIIDLAKARLQRERAGVARRSGAQRGMTLVEIMVVVVIISLVATVVGVSVFSRLEEARRQVAKTQIHSISDALDLYRLSMRNYPSTSEGLQALVSPKGNEKPFLPNIPKDPWGNDYVYIFPGQHNAGGFDLMSYGPDWSKAVAMTLVTGKSRMRSD